MGACGQSEWIWAVTGYRAEWHGLGRLGGGSGGSVGLRTSGTAVLGRGRLHGVGWIRSDAVEEEYGTAAEEATWGGLEDLGDVVRYG